MVKRPWVILGPRPLVLRLYVGTFRSATMSRVLYKMPRLHYTAYERSKTKGEHNWEYGQYLKNLFPLYHTAYLRATERTERKKDNARRNIVGQNRYGIGEWKRLRDWSRRADEKKLQDQKALAAHQRYLQRVAERNARLLRASRQRAAWAKKRRLKKAFILKQRFNKRC